MREFPLTIPLDKGLRPDFRTGRNNEFLFECFNGKVNKFGLQPYDPIEIPFAASTLGAFAIDFEWPWPQLFKGSVYTILATDKFIFLVNEDDWSLFDLNDLRQALSPTLQATVTRGNRWKFADFGETWFLHNGMNTVFHSGKHIVDGSADVVYVGKTPRVQAGCAFKGRNYMGGFDSDKFWQAAIKTFFKGLADKKTTGLATTLQNLGPNHVWWSSASGGDMTFLFHVIADAHSSIVTSSTYSSTQSFWIDKIRENTWGFRRMPWKGRVWDMMPLGDVVMVYGEGGVTALVPDAEGVVGMKKFPMLNMGCYPEAVGGNEDEHLFMANDRSLWYIDANLKPSRLGYKEYMQSFVGTTVAITHDSSESDPDRGNRGEFYICDGNKAFILTGSGLTEHSQQITSLINTQGKVYGMGQSADGMADKTFTLRSDTVDMGWSDLKRVQFIEMLGETPVFGKSEEAVPTLQAFVDFSYSRRQAFSTSDLVTMNDEGVAHIGVSAKQFRIGVKAGDFRDVNIDRLVARYQVEGKRYIRGPNAAEGAR